MSRDDNIDLQAVKTFYDPHPGFAGATIPLPDRVKRVIDQFDGQSLTLAEAVKRLSAVTSGQIKVVAEHGYIALYLGGGDRPLHFFRLIRFR